MVTWCSNESISIQISGNVKHYFLIAHVHKLMSCDAVLANNTALHDRKYVRNKSRSHLVKLNITSCSAKKTKIYHIMKLYLTTTNGKYNYVMSCKIGTAVKHESERN